jgi:hypothetical protein
MTTYLSGPSLAAATGTRLDSAAKHIQQCRVSQDHMQEFVTFDDQCESIELVRNKMRYCVHKDELVLQLGKPWLQKKKYSNSAYPRVVSNLGRLADRDNKKLNDAIKMIIYVYHNAISIEEREKMLDAFRQGTASAMDAMFVREPGTPLYFNLNPKNNLEYECKKYVPYVYDFVAAGYANTLGWAHANSGDTMTSVHIGGLRTVQNGHFEIMTGDLLQWYWPFEYECFEKSGKRKPITVNASNNFVNKSPTDDSSASIEAKAQQRKDFFDRQFGQMRGVDKHVAYIKPFKRDDLQPRIYDHYRVFARAISSARPFEAVDICISRQAI